MPGRNTRPTKGPVVEVARRAPKVTVASNWTSNDAYLFGFHLYSNGFFWEAHEVWEPVWLGTPVNSPERFVVKGLIQISNCCLKLAMHRRNAAQRLAAEAAACFDEALCRGAHVVMGLKAAEARLLAYSFLNALLAECRPPDGLLGRKPIFTLDKICNIMQ